MTDALRICGLRRNVGFGKCDYIQAIRFSRSSADRKTLNRTANYMHLTDCAFLFFKGMSLRIWDPEIECDLPCHEEIFDAAHPFTHPDFSFRRSMTAQQTFSALFAADQSRAGPHNALTMLDSFVLIHSKLRAIAGCLVRVTTG